MILIAFRHSDTRFFARLVTALRGGDSAHVEAAVPLTSGAAEGSLVLGISASFLDRGVRGKVLDVRDPTKWRVYSYRAPHRDPLEWLEENRGREYDFRGLIGVLAPPVGHDRDRRFCSEAVAEMLRLPYPHTYDLVQLERHVVEVSEVVHWVDGAWVQSAR